MQSSPTNGLSSNLKGETEGLLVAAAIKLETTRKSYVVGKWRANVDCVQNMKRQWAMHIASGCEVLALTEYISRHNNAAA